MSEPTSGSLRFRAQEALVAMAEYSHLGRFNARGDISIGKDLTVFAGCNQRALLASGCSAEELILRLRLFSALAHL